MTVLEIMADIERITTAPSPQQTMLSDLHDSINAIGGQPRDEYERGLNDAVGKALAIIEAKQREFA